MPGKSNALKRKRQHLKINPKRSISDSEMESSEEKGRNTVKKNKNPRYLSFEETGHTNYSGLKQVQIAPNKSKTWRPLSHSSRDHLRNVMDSVMIAVLSNNVKETEQIQHHLNFLKRRLLQLCDTLNVPPKKLKDLANMSYILKMEHVQCRTNEEGLKFLQEEIDTKVETAESMTESIQNLKHEIQILTNEVEEEDKKVQQLLQRDSNKLYLPELSQKSLRAPILQEEILTLIPNKNTLLEDLDILHNSSQIKNMLTLLEETFKRLDAS